MTEPVQSTLTELKSFLLIKGGLFIVEGVYKDRNTISQCCATLHTDYIRKYPQGYGTYYDANHYKFLRFGPSNVNESHYKDTHPHRITLTIKDPTMNLKLDWPIL